MPCKNVNITIVSVIWLITNSFWPKIELTPNNHKAARRTPKQAGHMYNTK